MILTFNYLSNFPFSTNSLMELDSDFDFVNYQQLTSRTPDIAGENVKVWNIKQNEFIRINLVEMSGELSLHTHPDAEHSLMVLHGRVLVKIADKIVEITRGDFISIPAGVPHKYWSMTKTAMVVSMDAPYYDPKKTIVLEN